jgi:hypothetical protein
MDATEPKTPVSYSLTTPAVPLSLILTYEKIQGQYRDYDNLVVESIVVPVLALRAQDASSEKEDGAVHAIVLDPATNQLKPDWAAEFKRNDYRDPDGAHYAHGTERLCLTSEVEVRRKEAEVEWRETLLNIHRTAKAREAESKTK